MTTTEELLERSTLATITSVVTVTNDVETHQPLSGIQFKVQYVSSTACEEIKLSTW